MIDTFKVRRRCLIADRWREYGEPVPEAHTWRIVESEVSTGVLERTTMGESEFSEAIQTYCPDLAEEIYALLDVTPFDPNELDPDPIGGSAGNGEAATRRRGRSRAPVLTTMPEPLES